MRPIRGNNKSFQEVNRDLRRLEKAMSAAADPSFDNVTITNLTIDGTLTIDALAGLLKATAGAISAVNPNLVVYPGPATADLTNERVLTAGANITLTDGGAGGAVTVAATGLGASSEAFVTIGNTAGLTAERALTAGNGIDITDGGANSTVTIDADINTTNLQFTATEINTIQDIATTSSPTFNSLTLTTFTGFTAANWIDLTDGGSTTLHTHASTGITDFNEAAQDAVGNIFVDSARIDFTYTDATPSITADLILDTITVGYMHLTGNYRLVGRGPTAGAGAAIEVTLSNGVTINGSNALVADINSTNLQFTAFQINTIQNIATTSSPTFAGLTLTGFSGLVKGTAGVLSAVNPNVVIYPGPATADLANERILTAGTNITLTDGGAGGNVTIATTGVGASSEAYVTIGNTAGLSAERALTAGDGIDITDGGANSTVTIHADINTTNLRITATEINTIQDIHTSAVPSFLSVDLGDDDPSTIGVGQITYADTVYRAFAGKAAIGYGSIPLLLYRNTADSNTVSNTAAETDFNLTYDTQANWARTGTALRVWASGTYTTDAVAIPQLRIKGYIGSALVYDSGDSQVSISAQRWFVSFNVHVTNAGTGASVCQGFYHNNRNHFVTQVLTPALTIGSAQTIKLSADWSAADTDNGVTIKMMEIWLEG